MTLDTPVTPHQPAAHGRSPEHAAPGLARSAARIGARSRLDRELRFIAADLLGPYASEELPADCSVWVHRAIDSAVAGVRDASLTALVELLEAELAQAPPAIARRLDEARIRHDAGFI